MDKQVAAREYIYTNAKNTTRDTNLDGQKNKHSAVHRSSKLFNNVAIIPIKMRNQKTDIVIPPITAAHKRTLVEHLDIEHIQRALETRNKFMQYW